MLEKRPIAVTRDGDGYVALGGNQRLRAMLDIQSEIGDVDFEKRHKVQAAEMETLLSYFAKGVPVVDCTELTPAQQKRFIIADNIPFGEWDWEALANEWDVEELQDWGMQIPNVAFDGLEVEEEQKSAEEDDFEVPDEIQTDIVLGDLFEIGPHRLLCGDSTNTDSVNKLTRGESIEIIYTDPPYSSGGFQESGKTSGSIGARGSKKIATDNLSTRGYISLMDKVLGNLSTAHTAFIFCDWKMWVYNQDIAEAKGYRVRNMIVWDKMQMGMGMPFRNQHELCLFGSKLAGKIGDGRTPNVIQSKRDRESKHATPKPIDLITKMLNQVEGNLIIDPFLGGGSTMVAAHQLDRICYGLELDPKYCQVIVDRMLALDPNLKVLKNGQPYN
jgi:DNA modification methylase